MDVVLGLYDLEFISHQLCNGWLILVGVHQRLPEPHGFIRAKGEPYAQGLLFSPARIEPCGETETHHLSDDLSIGCLHAEIEVGLIIPDAGSQPFSLEEDHSLLPVGVDAVDRYLPVPPRALHFGAYRPPGAELRHEIPSSRHSRVGWTFPLDFRRGRAYIGNDSGRVASRSKNEYEPTRSEDAAAGDSRHCRTAPNFEEISSQTQAGNAPEYFPQRTEAHLRSLAGFSRDNPSLLV